MRRYPSPSSMGPGTTLGAMVSRAWAHSRGRLSFRLVWICSGVFLVLNLLDRLGIVSRRSSIMALGLSVSGIVDRFWIHQVVTAPLLHADVWHLVFNMLALWMLGPDIEIRLGQRRYVVFSIVCAVASMLGGLAFTWGTSAITLGYSGVIFGILVAQALFFPERRILMFWVFPMKMRHAVILFAAIALYAMVTPGASGGISHAAHLFGGIAGYLYLRPPRWLQHRTGWTSCGGPSATSPAKGQRVSMRSRLRLVVYWWREWKYRIRRKLR